ncbi:MAG TPA: hypothetical protein VNA14_02250, partial [Mycobacteriales bacterium]|nr:hypothetical protein [Mycobacteriales bacterium]
VGDPVPGGIGALAIADDVPGFVGHLHRLLTDDSAWRAQRAQVERLLQMWADTGRTAMWPDVLAAVLKEGRRELVALRT